MTAYFYELALNHPMQAAFFAVVPGVVGVAALLVGYVKEMERGTNG